jgi:hypothetical protein
MFYKIKLVDGTTIELPMNSNSYVVSHGSDYTRWWCYHKVENKWLFLYSYLRETEDGKFFCEFTCEYNEEVYLKNTSLYTEVKSVEIKGDEL